MYQLSQSFIAHKSDVLSLAVTADDCIVSCSRDKTTKLWKCEGNHEFIETETYSSEHNLACKFQTCVCVLLPSDLFEYGLILTGDNDNRIFVYEPNCSSPIRQLRAHSNAVSRISPSTEPNTFLSASWDSTVKIWFISEEEIECLCTIDSHSVSVWAVLQTKQKFIVTGSADKLIRVFSEAGSLNKILSGHEDCVRDIVEVDNDEILSCSNDTTVRRWSLNSGKCLEILNGHSNYVYSVRTLGNFVVSCGEDRRLLFWSQDEHVQTITLPARSVWAIGILSNNDIVTGTSDGIIRIFTSDKKREADKQILHHFENECANFQVPLTKCLGRVSSLPGPEKLSEPGIKEGQTIFTRDSGKVICYSWSVAEKTWKNVGYVETIPKLALRPKDSNVQKNKKSVAKKPKEKYICAVCRRSFSRKQALRKHFLRKNSHSIVAETESVLVENCVFLQSILPDFSPFHVISFKKNGSHFMTELCLLNVTTNSDLSEWIRRFIEMNKFIYFKTSTRSRGMLSYSEFHRCQHSAVRMQLPARRKRRSKATGCKSSVYGAMKRDPVDNSCYCRVKINYQHNHPIDYNNIKKPTSDVRNKFRLLYYEGLSSAEALRAYKKHLELTSPDTYQEMLLDRSVCPDYDWVRNHFRKLQQNVLLSKQTTVGDTNKAEEPNTDEHSGTVEHSNVVEVDELTPLNAENHTEANENAATDIILESEQFGGMTVDEMIAEVEIGDDEESSKNLLRGLVDDFNTFLCKLEEDPRYYKSGIVSMCSELKKVSQSTAESRLLALHSFNSICSDGQV